MASLLSAAAARHSVGLGLTRVAARVSAAAKPALALGGLRSDSEPLGGVGAPAVQDFQRFDRRFYRHRGVLKLHCSECRYVIRRWHVPILAVDCNANVRHKQAMTNTPIRSRWSVQFPDHLAPWVEGKQYMRWPRYRAEHTFQCYNNKLRHWRLR
eukprot:TRINITY_DN47050_c0_g1_i1.p2 TRINITY_DN47050_c0_g1~~TRINITY_DN47050_c0_g1_i1.p2  ORF type:complete len:155 (+),score=31.81 TRINITY_DN47050_c0_g1_i1:86-550(+)